jgi:transposase
VRCIPPAASRDLGDRRQDPTKRVQERGWEVNGVLGVLERASIKIAAVATHMFGIAGLAILAILIAGRADLSMTTELAKERQRRTIPLLEQALTGIVRDHHRRLLTIQLTPIDFLDE